MTGVQTCALPILGAIGDALDEAEAAERDVGSDGPVVYDAESKDVSEDGE